MKTNAFGTYAANKPLEAMEIERPAPGEKDVAIDIDYCGICHSDIHYARNEWGISVYPTVPGHEIIGTVKEVGSKVTRFKTGDRVGVGCLVNSCRTCPSCKEGLENYCENGFTMTYGSPDQNGKNPTFGGYSTHIVVDQDFVLRVPDNLDPAGAAPLLCAGITTYSPLRYVGAGKGDKVAIMGLGGLGHMGVKLAASFGAEVTVLSRSPSKEEDAKRLGAHDFVLTTDEKSFSKVQNHFDYILDTVSAKHDLGQALSFLKRQGTLLLVGASDKPLDLPPFPLIFSRRKMMGSLIGGLPETQEMLDHCGKHNITSDIEMTEASKINEAFEKTLKAQVRYRFVIDAKTF